MTEFPPKSQIRSRWSDLILTIFLLVITAVFFEFIFWNVLTGTGIAPGADTSSFAHTAKYIVDYLLTNHRFPPIDLQWYGGFELQQAPPMISIVLGTIYFFTRDIEVATHLLTGVGSYVFFLIMFFMMRKDGYPTLNAWMSGILYAFMPSILLTYGSYTKFVALMFLPFVFYFTSKTLTDPDHRYRHMAMLALMVGCSVYSHPMNGFVFALCAAFYGVIYAWLDPKIIFKRIFNVFGGIMLGMLFASNFIIPFVFEKAGRTAVPYEELNPYIYTLKDMYNSIVAVAGGLFTLLLLYPVWRYRQPKLTAIFLTGVFAGIICLAYMELKIGRIFPFNLSYSYIWPMITAFCCAYVAGSLIGFKNNLTLVDKILRFQLVFVLVLAYFWSTYTGNMLESIGKVSNTDISADSGDRVTVSKIAELSNNGRVYPSHYPFGFLNWVLTMQSDKASVEGHYYGIARISHQIAIMADAIHNRYPDYTLRKLKNLNVRYIIANHNLIMIKDPEGVPVGQQFLDRLKEKTNFKQVYQTNEGQATGMTEWGTYKYDVYRLFYDDTPSNYLVPIEDKILTIGKFGPTLAAAVTPAGISMAEGGSIYLDEYDLDFLKHFDTVVLYGFGYHNREKAEKLARDYVAGGGNLVIEMFGINNSKIEENPRFLEVRGYNRKLKADSQIDLLDKSYQSMMIENFWLPAEIYDEGSGFLRRIPFTEWNLLEYVGLDESVAQLPNDTNIFSILGYKNLTEGKVTFVGANLFYHLYVTHDPQELSLVSSLLMPKKKLNSVQDEASTAPTLKSQQTVMKAEKFEFKIQNSKAIVGLVSLAQSKHWHAYIDGKEVKIMALEDMMAVDLPAGDYTLTIQYGRTLIKDIGIGVSVLTFIGLIVLIIYSNLRQKPFRNTHRGF